MIEIRQLAKSYGDRQAVREIDFSVNQGETFGLLGPNGAGKTTTIGMLVGLVRPDAGYVSIAGGDPQKPEVRRRIGLAPQALSLYENLSARENLNFFGTMYGLSGKALQQATDRALELAGLTDRAKDRVSTFSGGMKRRLNIAVSLVHSPEVLLLDEPTVGVDPQSRNHILDCVRLLARQGMTILYTTHYMEEAQRLCDRVAIIDHGKILANKPTENLIKEFGGDSSVSVDVEHCPEGVTLPDTYESGRLLFCSPQPLEDLSRLQRLGVNFGQIKIEQPNLESVFLSLTGRTLRD